MDAAIAGLIGSLGGVILGATAQALQAARSRRWQLQDQKRASDERKQTQLWQDRRLLYASFMTATFDVTNRINWVVTAAAAHGSTSDALMPPAAAEAMGELPELIKTVLIQADEVRLVTESAAVSAAVGEFIQALISFSPSSPRAGETPRGIVSRLVAGRTRFTDAARSELGIPPLSDPLSQDGRSPAVS